jgi:hypothetical protein
MKIEKKLFLVPVFIVCFLGLLVVPPISEVYSIDAASGRIKTEKRIFGVQTCVKIQETIISVSTKSGDEEKWEVVGSTMQGDAFGSPYSQCLSVLLKINDEVDFSASLYEDGKIHELSSIVLNGWDEGHSSLAEIDEILYYIKDRGLLRGSKYQAGNRKK